MDFVSTHVYANDSVRNVLGTDEPIAREQMVWRAVGKSACARFSDPAYPDLPLILSEFNASFANEPNITDSDYMGPWLANTIRLCDGLTESMAYWAFSDVFEEQGVVRTPFYGGFGLIAADHIDKPVMNAFRLLHKLGDRRIALDRIRRWPRRALRGLSRWHYGITPRLPAPDQLSPAATARRSVPTVPPADSQCRLERTSTSGAWTMITATS